MSVTNLERDDLTTALRELQGRALELAIENRPLRPTLEGLVGAVEETAGSGMMGSILLLDPDGVHLRHGAAPTLPDAYNAAIDGIVVGPGVGSCGTAVATDGPVYVSDIGVDPLWADFRDLALGHGLRACWSTPIRDAAGAVLGTFAMYYAEPRAPSPADLDVVEVVTRSAALIIQRERASSALMLSEERLRLAIEAAEIGFWDVDPVNDILSWPNRTKAMFGISPDVPVTMQDFYDGLHPDDLAQTAAAYAAAADPIRRALYDVEYRTIGKEDGRLRWVAAKGRGLFDETGRCIRIIGTAIDITHRKRAEGELRELNETLEVRVAARTAELESAHDQLRQSQKLEAIGQLTGGVAHDFNNLLTVIRGSVELLRRPDLTSDRRARYLDAVGDTADRAAALTQQLLAFARRQALKPEPFDVRESLTNVGTILSTLVGSRIRLDVTLPDHDAFALADRGQFDTAIVNMAVNARDAMDGVGRLAIAAGAVAGVPAMRNHPPQVGDFIAVTVADTGAGIAADDIDRIFEPFYTTKPTGAGTGLGLSQVFGFAKQSGGDLRVESRPGEGATFTLYVPRAYPEEAFQDRAKVEGSDEAGDGVCVLVVEDNPSVGEFAADALKTLGYDCVLAQDGQSALEQLAMDAGRFQVVFSDVVMPGIGGLELGALIRQRYADLPVILTSGYSHVLAQNGQHGFELLHKPYSIEQLSRVIRKTVSWQAGRKLASAPPEDR